jgi:hypothetical protein
MTEPTERTTTQVWGLGTRVLLVQVVTLIALWILQALFGGG